MACTNCPKHLDAALVRRFKQWVEIPLPDKELRKKILENLLLGMLSSLLHPKCPLSIATLISDTINDLTQKEWKQFQDCTEDWSGDDIVGLFSDLYTTYMGRMIDATHFKKVSA